MAWYSPPSRREISLLLFSLTTFILFYNLEYSFTFTTERLALSNKDATDTNDTEDWHDVIYGNWTWEETQVAENAQKQANNNMGVVVSFRPQIFGSVSVNDGTLDWADQIPTTEVLKHVAGYTIMDNVFMLNGTLFIVTNDPFFPKLDSIASSSENSRDEPRPSDWQILSSAQAADVLGSFGGLIHGVSWLVTDASPSNYTLFSLWRTYSALDTSISSDELTLPPPRRIFYPQVRTFTGEKMGVNSPIVPRTRSPSGFHPYLAKAAFPTLGLMYQEDWDDYALLHVPFMMKRVVVADQGAARRARPDVPAFAVPLVELGAATDWWEPIRRHIARFLDVPEEAPKRGWLTKTETVVTYLSRQDAARGPKLRNTDHEALTKALGELGKGYTVHVVSSETSWTERMMAITQSTVVLGVYGDHLADSVYMPPSSRTTVMEMFPPGVFVRDVEMAAKAVQMQYFAWWEARRYSADGLPSVVSPDEEISDDVPIDVGAVVQAIRRIS